MKIKSILTVIMIFFILSCVTNKETTKNEINHIENCRNNWTYKYLENETEITVLIFSEKFRHSITMFPNFIIGITQNSDTVAIVDKDFNGKLTEKELIIVKPTIWTDLEKENLKPVFTVYKKSKMNDLTCSVKTVYYGNIEKK